MKILAVDAAEAGPPPAKWSTRLGLILDQFGEVGGIYGIHAFRDTAWLDNFRAYCCKRGPMKGLKEKALKRLSEAVTGQSCGASKAARIAARLVSMGLLPGAEAEVLSNGGMGPFILAVRSSHRAGTPWRTRFCEVIR